MTAPASYLERDALKTKKVAGHFDLPASSFAYVGDLEDPATWKLPIFVPGNVPVSRNLLKSALFRFSDTKDIPASERQNIALTLNGAAKAHGIRVRQQSAPTLPGSVRPKSAQPLDAMDLEVKEARALGSLYADRLLEKIEMEWVK